MTFAYIAELAWWWGYPAVWLLMLAMGLAMLLYFRRKRWL
jgi:magnesium transporter